MEFVPGTGVRSFCDDRQLPVAGRMELFRRICEGVHHAHQKGVIHRDLKPSNILVVERDEGPVPKIIDFGIARAVHSDANDVTFATRTGLFPVTPSYMSPEQALGSSDQPGLLEPQRRIRAGDGPPVHRAHRHDSRRATSARNRRTRDGVERRNGTDLERANRRAVVSCGAVAIFKGRPRPGRRPQRDFSPPPAGEFDSFVGACDRVS